MSPAISGNDRPGLARIRSRAPGARRRRARRQDNTRPALTMTLRIRCMGTSSRPFASWSAVRRTRLETAGGSAPRSVIPHSSERAQTLGGYESRAYEDRVTARRVRLEGGWAVFEVCVSEVDRNKNRASRPPVYLDSPEAERHHAERAAGRTLSMSRQAVSCRGLYPARQNPVNPRKRTERQARPDPRPDGTRCKIASGGVILINQETEPRPPNRRPTATGSPGERMAIMSSLTTETSGPAMG